MTFSKIGMASLIMMLVSAFPAHGASNATVDALTPSKGLEALDELNREAEILKKQIEVAKLQRELREANGEFPMPPVSGGPVASGGMLFGNTQLMQPPTAPMPAIPSAPVSEGWSVVSIQGAAGDLQAVLKTPDGAYQRVRKGTVMDDKFQVESVSADGVQVREVKSKNSRRLPFASGK